MSYEEVIKLAFEETREKDSKEPRAPFQPTHTRHCKLMVGGLNLATETFC
jgi:hypothetical protein